MNRIVVLGCIVLLGAICCLVGCDAPYTNFGDIQITTTNDSTFTYLDVYYSLDDDVGESYGFYHIIVWGNSEQYGVSKVVFNRHTVKSFCATRKARK